MNWRAESPTKGRNMADSDDRWGWISSFVAGMAFWAAIAVAGGRTEPWDSGLYWAAGYPLALVLAGVLGALFPHRPWRWGLAFTFAQLPVMLVGGSGLGLLPLGLIAMAILAVPPMLTAKLGAWLRGWLAA